MVLRKKLVIVGDGFCGKTCLLMACTEKKAIGDERYVSTVFENTTVNLQVGEKSVSLQLQDTPGQEDYDKIRALSYIHSDVLLLCFSVDSRDSFENVLDLLITEVECLCPNVPIVLVGNKIDLRCDEKTVNHLHSIQRPPVTRKEGVLLAKKIKAICYIECSSRTYEGVEEVFQTAVRATLKNEKIIESKKMCCVL